MLTFTPEQRINRIRLEFKVVAHVCFLAHAPGLIESDWNLKLNLRLSSSNPNSGLIESDWNLKCHMHS